jgi:single-strand DNA-binding protein
MTLNQILLIGRAGTDPQMRYTPSGTAVTDFRLAVNNPSRGQDGEWQDNTEWFTVTAWERQAESVNQFLVKGRRVFVEGRLSTRTYTANDGQQRTSLEVRANRVIFLDRPEGQGDDFAAPGQARGAATAAAPAPRRAGGVELPENSEDVEELPW